MKKMHRILVACLAVVFALTPILAFATTGNLVSTSNSSQAVTGGYQRSSFYANGLYWTFYQVAGTSQEFYRTSSDGVTWGNATLFSSSAGGVDFSVYFDGTYMSYVLYWNHHIYYRRGVPQSNGTFSWSAAEQTVYNPVGTEVEFYGDIAVDSTGHEFISYTRSDTKNQYVTKNANDDGTWSTDIGYPILLEDLGISTSVISGMIADSSGNVFVAYQGSNTIIHGLYYNGSSWGSIETVSSNTASPATMSMTQQNGLIGMVYYDTTAHAVEFTERTSGAGGVWSSPTSLSGSGSVLLALASSGNGDLVVFKMDTDYSTITYKRRTSGVWDTNWVAWLDESTDTTWSLSLVSTWTVGLNNKIGLLYQTKQASPYNVKFALLNAIPPTPPTVTTQVVSSITQTTATGNGNITSIGSDNPSVRGIVYSTTNQTPTTADSKVQETGTWSTGAFAETITGVQHAKTYYVRAFATNGDGTAYGTVVSFSVGNNAGFTLLSIVGGILLALSCAIVPFLLLMYTKSYQIAGIVMMILVIIFIVYLAVMNSIQPLV